MNDPEFEFQQGLEIFLQKFRMVLGLTEPAV
jgi:hypothetical protein